MELDVPIHSYGVLRTHLQDVDKQKEIELYYELLSSGHSVGEILDSLSNLRCKSMHGNVTTAEQSSSRVARAPLSVTSEAALMGVAPENTQRISDLTAPVEAESGGTDDPRLDKLESGDWPKLADKSFSGSETNIDRSAAVHIPAGSGIAIPPGNHELRHRSKFPVSTKQVAIGALYTVAVASASIASFAYVSGGLNTHPTTTRVQSGISGETKAIAIQASTAEGSETVDESLKATTQIVNTNGPSELESSRSVDPHAAVPGSLKREAAAEVSIKFPVSTSYIGQAEEPSRQVNASALKNHDVVGSGTERSRDVSVSMGKETGGQQIVRAFYTALERGDGEAASLLVIPEKRDAGPFSAGELSNFYGRLEVPFHLIGVHQTGANLYNVVYTYKVRNGRLCNGQSLVRTVSLQNQVLIEGIRSPSRC